MAKASDLANAGMVQEQAMSLDQIWGKRITVGALIKMVDGNYQGKSTRSALCAVQIEDSSTPCSVFFGGRLGKVLEDYYTQGPGKNGEPLEDITVWLHPIVEVNGEHVKYNGWTILDANVTPIDYEMPQAAVKRLHEEMQARKASELNIMPI